MRTQLGRPTVTIVLSAEEQETLEEQPRHATHWSTRSMAAEMGMS